MTRRDSAALPARLDCGGKTLDLTQPQVMGVLNVTPDSFSDGGHFFSLQSAVEQARKLVAEGAAIIDVGGESTRPGAAPVTAAEECRRVVPVIDALYAQLPVPVSVDTSKPEVIRAAVAAGAGMVNDVRALTVPGALQAAVDAAVPVCLMHMQGEPRTMQQAPRYDHVAREVTDYLYQRVLACAEAGIPRQRIVLDPGFGFGKTADHNLQLLKRLDVLVDLGYPVLVGVSRKSTIGAVLDRPVEQRLAGGLALAALAVWQGARLIRAHDVAETRDAVRMAAAVAAA